MGVFGDGIEIRFTPGRLGGIHPDPRRVVQQRFGDHGLLAIGGVDLQRDLNTSGGNLQALYARSHLVLASRAAGIEPPIDTASTPTWTNTAGLRDQARFARSLGFYGKSAIHPRQLDTLHQVFTPTADEIEWAKSVLAGFDAASGAGFALPTGEFVDLPFADRARRLLEIAGSRVPAASTPAPVSTA